ncbi:MAG: LacI family DNA-binding transcriptional regulator [Prevotella sp.]|nr:LacI family DNA-binding transcriptional regulator [Prevotella sp.]
MSKRVTIKDLAKALGISTSTVSRALADTWDVKGETRERVLDMARRMDYHPNVNAKNLQNKSTGTIGVIIPEFVNSFFPHVVMGIQEILYEAGYRMLIAQSNESKLQERENLKMLIDNMVDGIIISVTCEGGNEEYYQNVIEHGMPVVFFNRVCENVKASKVVIDDVHMAEIAVEHLISTGHQRIIHFAGPENLAITGKRTEGYINALRKHHMEIMDDAVVPTGIFIEDGKKAMEKLLKSGTTLPDAVFCFNDPVAVGVMKALKNAGKRIPEDVAIIGFSEDVLATVVEPELTTVLQPMHEMGCCAARIVLEQIKADKAKPYHTIVLEGKLKIRKSSAL